MNNLGPYEGFTLRKTNFPKPVAVSGWWRWRWSFEARGGSLRPVVLPPPVNEVDRLPVVVSSSYLQDGQFVVDCYAVDDELPGDALAYVSVIAVWIQHRNRDAEVVVNGVRRHPLLVMSQLGEELTAELEAKGY
jgi:hypothetical protein